MGSVESEAEAVHAASRRGEVIDWLNSLFPDFDLLVDASDEELREHLSNGTVLCCTLNRLIPGVIEPDLLLHNYRGADISSVQRLDNVKRFLSIIIELGLPGFSAIDLEQGSMSAVVECLLTLRDHLTSEPVEDRFHHSNKSGGKFSKRWGPAGQSVSQGSKYQYQQNSTVAEDKKRGLLESKSKNALRSPVMSGNKFREVFQLKQGSHSDLPAVQISEMMHSNSFGNMPTQSLLSVVNGILDESIERKKGEIPHHVVYLLRKLVQEIERQISTQVEHIRNQNNLIKAREDKYKSRIKVLETLVNGTSDENQTVMNRLQLIKVEKSKTEEKNKLDAQDVARLMKEREKADHTISKLEQEIEMTSKMYEQHCEQIKSAARETEAHLTRRIKEVELLLAESTKKIEELKVASVMKLQLWSRKEQIFKNFTDNQLDSVKDVNMSFKSIKQEVFCVQSKCREEISNFGLQLKGLVDAAENYHRVLSENQRLFNEVQELKGNIRVYCRMRPFHAGQNIRSTTIDYVGENGELLISNPFKQGKDGHRMFKFNKVFHPATSQAEVFSDIQPLIRSVLDGYNVCIFAYGQTGSGKTYTMSGPGTSKENWGVNYRALNDLFDVSLNRRNTFTYQVEVQMIEIYNEKVHDLLSNNFAQKRLGIWSTSQPNGLVVPEASLHPVKSTSDVLDLMQIGQANRAVGATAINERSSRSHSILTVHVRGFDLKNGTTSRGCLNLIDLAGSERVERSEATGDRLKEAQYINKSLSALGDVIFALAQKSAHVPYRNSKLTQVLQSSLGGQAKTLMFVQINPDVESYSETISTLKFAERVSGVELGVAKSNKEGKDVKELLEQVASLKDVIAMKDDEIQLLQQLKDVKAKTLNGDTERNGSNALKYLSSSQGIQFLEFNRKYSELNGEDASRASPVDMELASLDEPGFEERMSDISDSSFSMEAETNGSMGNAMELNPFIQSGKHLEITTEKAQKTQRIAPPLSTKGGLVTIPRQKHKEPLKSPGHLKSPASQTSSTSLKPPRRRQKS